MSYLTGQLSMNPPINPVGASSLLQKLLPMMPDTSKSVRGQLLKLLQHLPDVEIRPHVVRIMLYIRSAMTHISHEVKDDGLNYLEWLLDVAGPDVVASPGCWVKPLRDLISVLGWAIQSPPDIAIKGGWTNAPRTTFGAKKYGQSFPRQMLVLSKFLEHGLKSESPISWNSNNWFQHLDRVPKTPDPYGYMGLFKPPRDEDGEIYRNREDRQAIFCLRFLKAVCAGADMAKKEGGAAGRAAAILDQTLRDGIEGHEIAPGNNDEGVLWLGYVI